MTIHLRRTTVAIALAVLLAFALLSTVAFVRTANANHRFNDIADGTFYHDSTAWLADNGIANGFPDGSFGTGKTITRGQASFWFSNFNDNIVAPHQEATTDVHGIADTSVLATDSDVAAHATDTTDIHGIADTSVLATDSDVSSAIAGVNSTDDITIVTAVKPAQADSTLVQGFATCPAGKRAISGGGSFDTTRRFAVAASEPSSGNPSTWVVSYVSVTTDAENFPGSNIHVVCVPNVPAP